MTHNNTAPRKKKPRHQVTAKQGKRPAGDPRASRRDVADGDRGPRTRSQGRRDERPARGEGRDTSPGRRDDRRYERDDRPTDSRRGNRYDRDDRRTDRSRGDGERYDGRRGGERSSDRYESRARRGDGERRYDSRSDYNDTPRGDRYDRRDDGGRGKGTRDERRTEGDRGYGNRDERSGRSYGNRDERGGRSYADRDSRRPRRSRDDRPGRSGGDRRGGRPRGDRNAPRAWTRVLPTLDEPTGFTPLGVPDPLAAQLLADGISDPFPIQQAAIPDALAGRDILGRGRTGSGKTLAFGIPMITRLAQWKGQAAMTEPARGRSPRGMILVPTRELAGQVVESLQGPARVGGLDIALVIGGASYDKQIRRLSKGTDIVVATPGRLYDLIERGAVDLSEVRVAVLDEADQMADMGFLPQVEVLMELLPSNGQRMLFSATLDRDVDVLVSKYLTDPAEHATDPGTASITEMTHSVRVVRHGEKMTRAGEVVTSSGRTIIFVRTRELVEDVADHLDSADTRVDGLHGGMSQRARSRALEGFRRGHTRVLVATDVAARGIHVDGIDTVLQMDMPNDHKDYLHRAGRTARAGAGGTVVTLITPAQRHRFTRLAERAGVSPDIEDLPGWQDRPRGPRGGGGRDRDHRPRQRPAHGHRRQGRPRDGREAAPRGAGSSD